MAADDMGPSDTPPRSSLPVSLPAWLPDLPTCLFGAGTFLVILYMFLPQINAANVASREARVISGDLRWKRVEAEYKAKLEKGDKKKDEEKVSDDDKERFQQAKEKWEKRKRELEEASEDAEEWRRRATWWHRWGMMFGLLLLSAGSLGFLNPAQPPTRRLIGTIVLLALVVTVVTSFAGFGISFSMGPR